MKALTWHGKRDVRIDTVPDPAIEHPTDAIIRVTSTGLCGSDLHLYEVACRIAQHFGAGQVIGLDLVAERLARSQSHGVNTIDVGAVDDVPEVENAGVDRLSALNLAVEIARRGGTISLSGVYGGTADPINMLQIFDKQLTLRMGQANVRRWVNDILPLLSGDEDPLGVEAFATHHVPLAEAPAAYEMFHKKEDGAFKVVFKP